MATRAKTTPAADPLADLREPAPAAALAIAQPETAPPAAPEAPDGYTVTLDAAAAMKAAVAAMHRDDAVAVTIHKGGTCPCARIAALVLAVAQGHITVHPNSEPPAGDPDE